MSFEKRGHFLLYNKKYELFKSSYFSIGAGSGNRTRIASLEGWNSTIELHLHLLYQGHFLFYYIFIFLSILLLIFFYI